MKAFIEYLVRAVVDIPEEVRVEAPLARGPLEDLVSGAAEAASDVTPVHHLTTPEELGELRVVRAAPVGRRIARTRLPAAVVHPRGCRGVGEGIRPWVLHAHRSEAGS